MNKNLSIIRGVFMLKKSDGLNSKKTDWGGLDLPLLIKLIDKAVAEALEGTPSALAFYNEGQLAKRWGVSVKTLQKWRLEGGGPRYCKLGACIRYAADDVTAFEKVASQAHTSDMARKLSQSEIQPRRRNKKAAPEQVLAPVEAPVVETVPVTEGNVGDVI